MSKIYVNAFLVVSATPFPVDADIDLVQIARDLGLDPVEDQSAYLKKAARAAGWKEDMSNDPRFALTPIPENSLESDVAQITAANNAKLENLRLASDPQWFLEDLLATTTLALIREEEAKDVPPRQAPAFNKIFDQQFDIA